MAIPQTATLLHHLRQTVLRYESAALSDGQLLRSYLYQRDETAFEALVRRHGPMVRSVCRRVLRNLDDADDAFQAAFLVLLRKASTLAMREIIGDWLHGVAYRTALKARTTVARRRLKEKQALRHESFVDVEDRSEWLPLLDEEIGRLPQKYRLPVVLCDLEGRTRKEAAERLGWPEGTLSGRLSRARAMLARRLRRRGVTLSAATLTAGMAGEASARLPFSLVGPICKAAMECAAGLAAVSVPAHVAALTEGVLKAMFIAKLKNAVALVMVALALTAGAGAWHYAAAGPGEERPREEPVLPAPKAAVAHAPKEEAVVPRPLPRAGRSFQIDLKIMERENGRKKLLMAPKMRALEGKTMSIVSGDCLKIHLGGGMMEQVEVGLSVHVAIRADKGDKVRLDLTVSRPSNVIHLAVQHPPNGTREEPEVVETKTIRLLRSMTLGEPITFLVGDKASSDLEMTANVQEVKEVVDTNTIAAAEKDLKTAEYDRRADRIDSARSYYELICRRYPDTIYAERAKERLAEMKKPKEKPPARVGQIVIIGNQKIADKVILKEVGLFPGQVLTFPDLDIAERKLSGLKGIRSAQVSVTDREGDGVFKDIQIIVEEK